MASLNACQQSDSIDEGTQSQASVAGYLAVLNAVSQVNQTTVNNVFSTSLTSAMVYPINVTQNCSLGGPETIQGALVPTITGSNPELIHYTYNYSVSFNQCEVASVNGSGYTVTGSNIAISGTSDWTITGSFTAPSFNATDNATIVGGIDVEGATSASCNVSLDEQLSQTGNNTSGYENGNLSGNICGDQINNPMSVTVSVGS